MSRNRIHRVCKGIGVSKVFLSCDSQIVGYSSYVSVGPTHSIMLKVVINTEGIDICISSENIGLIFCCSWDVYKIIMTFFDNANLLLICHIVFLDF